MCVCVCCVCLFKTSRNRKCRKLRLSSGWNSSGVKNFWTFRLAWLWVGVPSGIRNLWRVTRNSNCWLDIHCRLLLRQWLELSKQWLVETSDRQQRAPHHPEEVTAVTPPRKAAKATIRLTPRNFLWSTCCLAPTFRVSLIRNAIHHNCQQNLGGIAA